ncbi:exported hypothetical protein [Tenacibaculum litopenaei]|uniref:InlB B-repeat-containing protein n=1 Tax=Tenacibaculum litopenaei TaxID=396016 RepID=UPI00389509B4
MVRKLLLFCVLFTLGVRAQIPTNGLLNSYEFTNGALMGLGKVGSNAVFVNDRLGQANNAIALNGDRLVRGDVSYGANQATISFWIKTTTNTGTVQTIYDDANGRNSVADNHNWSGHYIFLQSGKVGYVVQQLYQSSTVGNGGRVGIKKVGGPVIADGNWHHVALKFRQTITGTGQYIAGREVRSYKTYGYLFVDGTQVTSSYDARGSEYGYKTNGNWHTVGNVTIASNRSNNLPGANRYTEVIDDIRLYNRELSSTEILNMARFNSTCFVLPLNTMSIANIGTTSAQVQLSPAGVYDVAYHKKGAAFSTATILTAQNAGAISMSNLDPYTEYQVYVKKNQSCQNWSDAKLFKTARPNVPYFVNANATGDGSGTSWANAYTSLQAALSAASTSTAANPQIWVAKGRYTPASTSRNTAFTLNKSGLRIYGGFAGNEATLTARNTEVLHSTNATILSGDLLGNDNATVSFNNASRADNSYRVVNVTANDVLIDGVIISGGYADAATGVYRYGAGLSTEANINKFEITRVLVKDNVAYWAAGLNLFGQSSSPISFVIDRCVFDNNLTSNAASGLYVVPAANTQINVQLTNSLFKKNATKDNGSRKGKGVSTAWFRAYNSGSSLNTTIVNNTFVNNSNAGSGTSDFATLGMSRQSGTFSGLVLANNIFWNNTNKTGATAVSIGKAGDANLANALAVSNSIDEDNFSNITSKTNTFDSNPLFVDAANDDFRVQACSKAVNGGDTSKLPAGVTVDLSENQRVANTTVDMGAYEQTSVAVCKELTLNIVGNGVVKHGGAVVNSGDTFSETTVLSLVPEAASGYQFEKWTGAAVGNANPLSLLMDADKTITVTFKQTITPIYVDVNATGANNGSSWANAYRSLTSALANVTAQRKVIWMADGVYKTGGNTNSSFFVNLEGVEIYGGFNGTETSIAQRNFYTNKTILSGDRNGNDSGALVFNNSTRYDNNRAIMKVTNSNVIIDGITIKDANAAVLNTHGGSGGGAITIYGTVSNFTLRNSILTNNVSDKSGPVAGVFSVDTNIRIENCTFYNNLSGYGTLYLVENGANKTANFEVVNSAFYKNRTQNVHLQSGFTGSSVWLRASAAGTTVTSKLINCTFANNTDVGTRAATEKGSVALSRRADGTSTHNAVLDNCIIYGNVGAGNATTADINAGHTIAINQLLVSNSTGEGNFAGIPAGNLTSTNNTDPLFVNPGANDFSLQASSPAKDSGANAKVQATMVTDIAGKLRIHNGTVDRGAYENGSTNYQPRNLVINAVGGTVASNPGNAGGVYQDGTVVNLTATPASGYQFDGWSGAATGTNATVNITMDADKTVTALFSKIQRTLTITAVNGTVTSNPTPNGGTYNDGVQVSLTATPAAGYQFDGWSGAASGTNTTVSVTMDANKAVTALFSKIQRSLIINATNGTVSTNPNPTNGKYNDGTVVSLTATPAAGYQFDGWSGAVTGTNATVSVTMDADKTVTALFSKIQRSLTINATNGTVSTNPNPTNGKYDHGTVVSLTATPAAGYQFDGWSGAVTGTNATVSVTMNADKTVTALFSKIQRSLTINATNGTVSSNPNPTNGKYDHGTVVSLTATPAAGYQFDGWSGAATGTNATVSVTMDADKTVTALFSKIQRTLTINATNGTVSTNPNPTNGKYAHGTVVSLTATPAAGYQFDGWSGAATGTNATVSVTMDADKTVTALFSKIQRSLIINATNGTVSTNPNPTNGKYDHGTVVSLTATPAAGYQFDGWSGAATGTNATVSVTMDADKTVTALFSKIQRSLTINATNGTVSTNPNPTNGKYAHGTVVSLTATPAAGYQFDGWSGAATGTNATVSVTMDADKTVTALFSKIQRTLTINATNGTVSTNPNPTNGKYDTGTVVSLTATPAVGYQFDGWSGAATGTSTTVSVTMDADKTVTALFSKIQRSLTINATNGSVSTNPNPTNGKYAHGTVVSLTATPAAGYQFDGWSGAATGTNATVSVTMDADKTVTAMFSKIQRTLTINATNGTVSTNPNPTNGKYADGVVVSLTATPAAGYQFDGWSGAATGTNATVSVTMDADKTVTAMFSKIQRTLTVNATNGTVSTNPNPTNGKYAHGTVVSLTATPAAGYQFDGWSGAASGSNTTVSITMDADKTVTALFSKIQRTLTINATNGTVSTNPNPVNGTYANGAVVVLTPTPANGYSFVRWVYGVTGSSSTQTSTSATLSITMNANMTVTAEFDTTASVDDETVLKNFEVYPNPAVEIVRLKLNGRVARVEVFDLKGQRIKLSKAKEIQVGDLAVGVYMVKVTTEDGKQGVKRFIKK